MSQNVSKLRQTARLQTIEKNILFMTQEELAEACNVDRKTIQRDIDKWRSKGGFKKFLIKEFFELYSKEKLVNPSLALNRVMALLLREEAKQAPDQIVNININSQVNELIQISRDQTCNKSQS